MNRMPGMVSNGSCLYLSIYRGVCALVCRKHVTCQSVVLQHSCQIHSSQCHTALSFVCDNQSCYTQLSVCKANTSHHIYWCYMVYLISAYVFRFLVISHMWCCDSGLGNAFCYSMVMWLDHTYASFCRRHYKSI